MILVTIWLLIFEIILVITAIILSKIERRNRQTDRIITQNEGRSKTDHKETSELKPREAQPTQFSLQDLEIATNNFSDKNKIGSGGFGCVYKGIIDGQIVAIKKIIGSSLKLQVDVNKEIALLSSFENDNLVKLLGFCSEPGNYLLVYEYVQNGDISTCLTDETKRHALDWKKRFNIILGIARGLFYLHHGSDHKIIHCDIKPENVLLDDQYNAKIADFGLSRILEMNKTHITDWNIAGTFGYIAPELWFEQRYSTRSDVYSYGLLILEILVGCTIPQYAQSNQENLIHVVWKQYKANKSFAEVIDSCLMDKTTEHQASRCIQIGLLCVQNNHEKRPDMEAVMEMLRSESHLPIPSFPAFFEVSQSRCSKDEAIGCFQIPLLCMEHHRMKKPNVKCIMPMLTNNHASPVSSTPAGFISSSRKRRRSKFPNSRSHTMRKIEIWFSAFSIKVRSGYQLMNTI